MIEWKKSERNVCRNARGEVQGVCGSFQESVGGEYIISLSPYGERCHLSACHVPTITVLGTERDLWADDQESKRAAAARLRAACEDHQATGATPSSSAAAC